MDDSAEEFPLEYRAFVSDLRALRKRQSVWPFSLTRLEFENKYVIAQVLETPDLFWKHEATLRDMHVHPTRTFVSFLTEAGWDNTSTPTYDQLRDALVRAADMNRRDVQTGGISVREI